MFDLAPHHKRGLALAHPWLNAAGMLGFAGEGRGLIDFTALGAFVTNALTWTPRTPARAPNVVDVQTGLILHTGLPNPGVRAAVRRYARAWARLGCPVIVHLAATSPADVARAIELLERTDSVSGVELGVRDDVTADELTQLIRAAVGGPPLIVRLPLLRAAELSMAAARAGADALTIGAPIRLTVQLDHQAVAGRFYGPDVFPLALAALQMVASQALELPLIGAGGIFSAENVRAMSVSGATAVQADAVWWRAPQFYRTLS